MVSVGVFYLVCAGGIAAGAGVGYISSVIENREHNLYGKMKYYLKRKRVMKTKKINSKDVCVICYEDFTDRNRHKCSIMRGCNHKYHKNCLKRWLEERFVCPLCNIKLDK